MFAGLFGRRKNHQRSYEIKLIQVIYQPYAFAADATENAEATAADALTALLMDCLEMSFMRTKFSFDDIWNDCLLKDAFHDNATNDEVAKIAT